MFVVAGGVLVMGHETVQTRHALKEILPRLVPAFLTANAGLLLTSKATEISNALAQAVLGQGFDACRAANAIRFLILQPGDTEIFYILLALVAVVLLVLLLITFMLRVALTTLLVVAAPLALCCHALPQTDGLARARRGPDRQVRLGLQADQPAAERPAPAQGLRPRKRYGQACRGRRTGRKGHARPCRGSRRSPAARSGRSSRRTPRSPARRTGRRTPRATVHPHRRRPRSERWPCRSVVTRDAADAFHLSDGERQLLLSAERGTGLLTAGAGARRVPLQVIASRREHDLVTSDPQELADLDYEEDDL
ncbi:hypothetical protein ACFOWE_11495 [Planomonospora corallina]|uniref:Uncharacterized protein n=1 Tax=Planomonospora corallina TaxID=1806052 RepID=A0ABV8I4J1_9ACTN